MEYNRFKKTFVWMVANSYKGAIRNAIGMTLALTFVYSINGGINENLYMGETWELSKMTDMWGLTLFACSIVMVLCMANITKDMRNNDGRVMALMLPASNLENFLARIIWQTVSLAAICVVSVICADILRILLSYIFGWALHGSMLVSIIGNGMFFSPISPMLDDSFPFLVFLQIVLMGIYSHSFFTLGGTFFRRQPLLMTLVTSFTLSTLVSFIISAIVMHLPAAMATAIGNWFRLIIDNESQWFMLFFIIPTLAFTIFNYWASYKLYCRIQVISNKWINI